ncbi:PQQ-dependent sugar dehydrogenase [Pseudohongiella acticola]|jgi:quinoprotein glucose dehydrogenase|uniref:PQQ-dependent sugar dehydrogenase n=1 Tax=Pseudohongiella acticola TaxID=1524254 RepID=UPI0030EC73D4
MTASMRQSEVTQLFANPILNACHFTYRDVTMKQWNLKLNKTISTTLLGALLTTVSVPVLAQNEIIRGELPPMPTVQWISEPSDYKVEEFANDLQVVWSIKFAPDGRMFVTERPGRVRIISADGVMDPQPWLSIEERIFFQGESGLTGLAFHPDYPADPRVYVMYTYMTDEGPYNRISYYTDDQGRAGEETVLYDELAAQAQGGSHSGGTLQFGSDGMLYVATGDAFERQRSNDLDDLSGAVLRITPEGEVPADNPWADNPIWAHGMRNPHGLSWQPATGNLFTGDHGPTGEDGLMAHDRIVVLEGGRHHGWPVMVGAIDSPDYVDPILTFVPSSPPGDVMFYDNDLMPELQNDLFVSVLGFQPQDRQNLMRIRFQDPSDPSKPTAIERWFNDGEGNSVYGRLRALATGPDGAIYVGTSNHDGRQMTAHHREQPDRILRITPAN